MIATPLSYSIVSKLERETRKYFYLGLFFACLLQVMLFLLIHSPQRVVTKKKVIPVRIIALDHITTRSMTESAKKEEQPSPAKTAEKKSPWDLITTKGLPTVSLTPDTPGVALDIDTGSMESDFSLYYDEIALQFEYDYEYEPVPIVENELFPDDGIVKGMVIIPPNNRRAIQGYIHLASATDGSFAVRDTLNNTATDLSHILNSYTNIRAVPEFRPLIATREENWHRNPVLFVNASTLFMFSDSELDYLKRYMYSDGFLVIDNDMTANTPQFTRKQLNKLFHRIFSHSSWRTSKLQPRHPLFHSFFDIETVPEGTIKDEGDPVIWGLFLDQSLTLNALFLPSGYGTFWKDKNNRSQTELAVNIVAYGLARYEEIRDQYEKTRYVSDYSVRKW